MTKYYVNTEDVGEYYEADNIEEARKLMDLDISLLEEEEAKGKLFFVVKDETINEEIFEFYENALEYSYSLSGKHIEIKIALVKHYYKDEDDMWTYEDLSDTFKYISPINYVSIEDMSFEQLVAYWDKFSETNDIIKEAKEREEDLNE